MTDERADNLISKVIDGTATDSDWQDLTARAERRPELWRDLAESQRHQHVLSSTINEAVAVADAIAVPAVSRSGRADGVETMARRTSTGAWSGWAVAAVIALAAFANRIGMQVQDNQSPTGVQTAGYSSDQAFDAYLNLGREEGKVYGELPSKVIVSAREMEDGEGYEVICLQQIMIREVVPDLYEIAEQNERGELTLVQYKPDPTGF